MSPCGPVVSVAAELWALWEGRADAAAFGALETRYRSLAVALLGLGEVRRGTLEPGQSRLYLTRAPLKEARLRVSREGGSARARVTACKVDRNLQVAPLTEVRFGRRAAAREVDRKLTGLEGLLSVYLVNLSSARTFGFTLGLSHASSGP